jgi:hypothetical protein
LLMVNVDWLKNRELAECEMSEQDLYALAEGALHIAGILRRNSEA